MDQSKQPKILQRMLMRTAILGLSAAALLFGYQWVKAQDTDIDLGSVESAGWIGMISVKESGSNVAYLKPSGDIVEAPAPITSKADVPDATVRDFAWRPDGNRIFFSSDREENSFNIFRWNLSSNQVLRRTIGKVGKYDVSFGHDKEEKDPNFVYGGNFWHLNTSAGTAERIYPPSLGKNKTVKVNSEGDNDATEVELKLRSARLCGGGEYIAGIRKTDEGEILVCVKRVDEKHEYSKIVVAGERIWFDVDPVSGKIVYAVAEFRWPDAASIPPQYVKNNVATVPLVNQLATFDPLKPISLGAGQTIIGSLSPGVAFSSPKFSPDGKRVTVIGGNYKDGDVHAKVLLNLGSEPEGAKSQIILMPTPAEPTLAGQIYEPSWSPTGKTILFAMAKGGGKRDIYEVDAKGGTPRNLTNGKGNFTMPIYSPQTK